MGALNRSCVEENSCAPCVLCYILVLWLYDLGRDTCAQHSVRRHLFLLLFFFGVPAWAGAMGRPPLPPGHNERNQRLAIKRATWSKRAGKLERPTAPTKYRQNYRLKKVIDVASSQESSVSSASTTGSSASSSTLLDRSLRRRARGALDAIKTLGAEGERKLFQRSEMIGVLGRNGWTPANAACGANDMEVEVEVVSTDAESFNRQR